MQLPPDVTGFVEAAFAASEQAPALSALAAARLHDGTEPDARLLRCVVMGSRGRLDSLCTLVGMLAVDWRDVILCGEYELHAGQAVRVRDLGQPLPARA